MIFNTWRYDSLSMDKPGRGIAMRNIAADLLHERMQRAFEENPRGELYRTLPRRQLMQMLRQNIAELEVAFTHNNDVEDKLADCGNYIAFLLRNHVEPLEGSARPQVRIPTDLSRNEFVELLEHFANVAPELFPTGFRGRSGGSHVVTHPDDASNRLAHER